MAKMFLAVRWASGVQPNAIPIRNANGGQIEQFLCDDQRLGGGSVLDIHSGDSEPLDVAARFDGEQSCYGWNNESDSVQPTGRNPRWELGHGRFLIRIVIQSSAILELVFLS